ncbi:mynd domain-containing protein, partial [Colletotrichum musicola]
MTDSSSPSSLPQGLRKHINTSTGYKLLERWTYFHERPETDVYNLLIDTYRHRTWKHSITLTSGAVDGRPGFSTFLDKAEKAKSVSGGVPLLPKWWNEEKRKECEALGATDAKEWSSLAWKVSKDDIQRHYGDISLTMQLRCVGEK